MANEKFRDSIADMMDRLSANFMPNASDWKISMLLANKLSVYEITEKDVLSILLQDLSSKEVDNLIDSVSRIQSVLGAVESQLHHIAYNKEVKEIYA